jgi:hypothetical protein
MAPIDWDRVPSARASCEMVCGPPVSSLSRADSCDHVSSPGLAVDRSLRMSPTVTARSCAATAAWSIGGESPSVPTCPSSPKERTNSRLTRCDGCLRRLPSQSTFIYRRSAVTVRSWPGLMLRRRDASRSRRRIDAGFRIAAVELAQPPGQEVLIDVRASGLPRRRPLSAFTASGLST